jgi:hypothetical protein
MLKAEKRLEEARDICRSPRRKSGPWRGSAPYPACRPIDDLNSPPISIIYAEIPKIPRISAGTLLIIYDQSPLGMAAH